jgi:(S)-sulfolactate dehydrogenase
VARIIITEYMSDVGLEILRGHDVVYDPELSEDPERVRALVSGADGLIVRNRTRVSADLVDGSPALRVVGRLGVGLDNIDVDACRRRGIEVHIAFGENAVSVAEYVITAALMLMRGTFLATDDLVAGLWPRMAMRGLEMRGRTLGLVGFGTIAKLIAEMAQGLGLEVIAYDPYVPDDDDAWRLAKRVSLDALLADADAISIHVPLTGETGGLIDEAALAKMKNQAVLINTSRGGIVDERAVVEALRSGRLRGAALDVFAREPLGPEEGERFRDVPNLVLTPHIAGITVESSDRIAVSIAEAVDRTLAGVGR